MALLVYDKFKPENETNLPKVIDSKYVEFDDTTLKTINNQSIIGSGNITIDGGGGYLVTQSGTTNNTITVTASNITSYTVGLTLYLKLTLPLPTAAKIQINSLGAKNIKYNGQTTTFALAKANSYITLVYDGTNFNIISLDRFQDNNTIYATNSDTTATTIKVISVGADYQLEQGNILTVKFTNSFGSGTNQLRLKRADDTVVVTANIEYNGSTTNIPISAGDYATFVFVDGKFILQSAKQEQDPPESIEIITKDDWDKADTDAKKQELYLDESKVPSANANSSIIAYFMGLIARATSDGSLGIHYSNANNFAGLASDVKCIKNILDDRIIVLTQAEYDALGTKQFDAIYLIKED